MNFAGPWAKPNHMFREKKIKKHSHKSKQGKKTIQTCSMRQWLLFFFCVLDFTKCIRKYYLVIPLWYISSVKVAFSRNWKFTWIMANTSIRLENICKKLVHCFFFLGKRTTRQVVCGAVIGFFRLINGRWFLDAKQLMYISTLCLRKLWNLRYFQPFSLLFFLCSTWNKDREEFFNWNFRILLQATFSWNLFHWKLITKMSKQTLCTYKRE